MKKPQKSITHNDLRELTTLPTKQEQPLINYVSKGLYLAQFATGIIDGVLSEQEGKPLFPGFASELNAQQLIQEITPIQYGSVALMGSHGLFGYANSLIEGSQKNVFENFMNGFINCLATTTTSFAVNRVGYVVGHIGSKIIRTAPEIAEQTSQLTNKLTQYL